MEKRQRTTGVARSRPPCCSSSSAEGRVHHGSRARPLLLLLQERLIPLGATAPQPAIRRLRHMHATRFLGVEGPLGPRNMPSGVSRRPRAWHVPGALPERSLSPARPRLRAQSQWGPTTRARPAPQSSRGEGAGPQAAGFWHWAVTVAGCVREGEDSAPPRLRTEDGGGAGSQAHPRGC